MQLRDIDRAKAKSPVHLSITILVLLFSITQYLLKIEVLPTFDSNLQTSLCYSATSAIPMPQCLEKIH